MPDSSSALPTGRPAKQGVQVSVFDPVTGDTEKVDLSDVGYLVLTDNETYHVAALQHWPTSGTVQLTLKRGKSDE